MVRAVMHMLAGLCTALPSLLSVRADFTCAGSGVISAAHWEHIKQLKDVWVDLNLPDSRVLLRLLDRVLAHSDRALQDAAEDCGHGTLVLALGALRALDYERPEEARALFLYAEELRQALGPEEAEAQRQGWSILDSAPVLEVYPPLLGLGAPHDCGGTHLRLFVYGMPAPYTSGTLHCHHGQWGVEVLIPTYFASGTCRTQDPDEADFFLVPWYTWCERVVFNRSAASGQLPRRYLELMGNRTELLPHWQRRHGRDHIFIFGDQGLNYFPQWQDFIHSSLFLLTEALTPECGPSCYQPWKDVLIPGHTDFFRYRLMLGHNLPSEERPLLLNFHGRHPGTGPSTYWNNTVRGSIISTFEPLHDCSVGGFVDAYFEVMGASHFCLVPMGTSSWTNHLYESFFAGCVPVILSDDFELPFQATLPWQEMSVKWPMHRVADGLYEHLRGIVGSGKVKEMKRLVDEHACAFDFHLKIRPGCSPYHHLLRELEQRRPVRDLGISLPRFWGTGAAP